MSNLPKPNEVNRPIIKVRVGDMLNLRRLPGYVYDTEANALVKEIVLRVPALREIRNYILREPANEHYQRLYHQVDILYWAMKELSFIMPQDT